jgi:hypothetical protein
MSNRDAHFIRWSGSTIGDACRFNRFPRAQKMLKIAAYEAIFFGNDDARDELGWDCVLARAGVHQARRSLSCETGYLPLR